MVRQPRLHPAFLRKLVSWIYAPLSWLDESIPPGRSFLQWYTEFFANLKRWCGTDSARCWSSWRWGRGCWRGLDGGA